MKQKKSKTQLIDSVYNTIPDIQLKQVELVVNTFLEKVSETLAEGVSVEMRGFGSFEVVRPASKQNANGDSEPTKKRSHRIKFNAGKKLKEQVKLLSLDEENENK